MVFVCPEMACLGGQKFHNFLECHFESAKLTNIGQKMMLVNPRMYISARHCVQDFCERPNHW
jgi:hypothetical protein